MIEFKKIICGTLITLVMSSNAQHTSTSGSDGHKIESLRFVQQALIGNIFPKKYVNGNSVTHKVQVSMDIKEGILSKNNDQTPKTITMISLMSRDEKLMAWWAFTNPHRPLKIKDRAVEMKLVANEPLLSSQSWEIKKLKCETFHSFFLKKNNAKKYTRLMGKYTSVALILKIKPDGSQDRFIQFVLDDNCRGTDTCLHGTYLCSLVFHLRDSKTSNNEFKCKSREEHTLKADENKRGVLRSNLDFEYGVHILKDKTRISDRKRRDMDNGSDRLFTIAVPPDEMNQVAAMANFAMQTLDLIDVDNFKRKVINVADAKKQLTADGSGIMYYLQVSTQDTQCPEDTPLDNTPINDDCFNSTDGVVRACTIALLRSWVANSSPVNANVVKSECGPPV